MSNSLWPHELQHTRLPCPSASPKVCSNSCPLSQYAHSTVSSSVVPFSSCHQLSQHQGLFLRVTLHIRWPKYWSFSFIISPSNEYSGLISFKIDWFDLLAVQGTLKSLLQHHSLKTSILWHSAFSPEKAMAPHSSTLAWKIPWTEEPGRLRSMGSQRVGHDWATSLSLFTFMH